LTKSSRKAPVGWSRKFDDPIPLPRGRQLVTLKDAGTYITKLPKAEQKLAEWQIAMQALLLVVEQNGPTMFARIGMMQALQRNEPRAFKSDRKETHWGKKETEAG
jgi:hypothetical protein